MAAHDFTTLLAQATAKKSPIFLISGEPVLAEAQGRRLAEALAEKAGCEVSVSRRPSDLGSVLADLLTFSLFGGGKVHLVIDSALLADKADAAELIDEASDGLEHGPLPAGPLVELKPAQRQGASRLLQAFHLFGIDPLRGRADELIEALPKWVLQGGRALKKKQPRGRPAKEVEALRIGLAQLLESGRDHGLKGFAESELAQLGELLERGLPAGHVLVLVESSVAGDHPLVGQLAARKAWLALAQVEAEKGGLWSGLEDLAAELERETGVTIARDALTELARRTLRQKGDFAARTTDSDSTSRFAAEYRKLADLKGHDGRARIERKDVQGNVEDRGEEDVWQILDALGNGQAGEVLARYQRLISSADDPLAARLSFFSLLANFCRHLVAIAGMAQAQQVPLGQRNYAQFKDRWAAKLQADPPHGGKNPVAGIHPFRLHKAYLASSRLGPREISRLPWRLLETEQQIKGESSDPDAALKSLLVELARP